MTASYGQVLLGPVGPSSVGTATVIAGQQILELPLGCGACFEMFGQADSGGLDMDFYALDSIYESSSFSVAADPRGTLLATSVFSGGRLYGLTAPTQKILVSGLRQFVKVQLTIRHGIWTVTGAPVFALDQSGVSPAAPGTFLAPAVLAAITDTASHPLYAAQGAGLRSYLTTLTVTNSHATVGTLVTILDNVTAIYQGYAAPAGGGFSVTFPAGLIRSSVNTALNVVCTTNGANVYVAATGYQAT